MIFGLWVPLLVCSWAQPPSGNKSEQAAIQRAKNALVSSLDRSLPKVSLEFFLNYEAGGEPIKWEVTDCWEQTENPPIDQVSDSDMCVEADFEKDQTDAAVLVSVGTFAEGPTGVPAFFSASVTGPSGKRLPLRHLGDLPMALHRPSPRLPRNLLDPLSVALSSVPGHGRIGPRCVTFDLARCPCRCRTVHPAQRCWS